MCGAAFGELCGAQGAAFLQGGVDAVVEFEQIAFFQVEVGDGVVAAVKRAGEAEGVRAASAGEGVAAASAFDVVVARAAVDAVVAVVAEEVVGGAVALDGVVARAAFGAFDLCAVADEELAAVRLAVAVEHEVVTLAARVVPAARREVEEEVLRLVGGIEHVLPATIEDVDAVAEGVGIEAAEMVGVVAAVVVGVDAVAVMQGDEVVDALFGGRERRVVDVVLLAVQTEGEPPGMLGGGVGHQGEVVAVFDTGQADAVLVAEGVGQADAVPDFVDKGRPAGGEELAFAVDDVLFAVAEGVVGGKAFGVEVDIAAVARVTGNDAVFAVSFLGDAEVIKVVMQGGIFRPCFDEADVGVAADVRHRRADVGFLRFAEDAEAAQVEAADAVVGVGREVVAHGQRLAHDVSGEVAVVVVAV